MLEEQVKDVEVKSDERVSDEQRKYKEILVIIKLVDIAEIVTLQRHNYLMLIHTTVQRKRKENSENKR